MILWIIKEIIKPTQAHKVSKETQTPVLEPKNFLKIAPVYPIKAEISNFNKIKIRERSIGLKSVANKENLSNG